MEKVEALSELRAEYADAIIFLEQFPEFPDFDVGKGFIGKNLKFMKGKLK